MKTYQVQNKFYYIYLFGIILILFLPMLSVAPLFHPPAWAKSISFRIIFSILLFLFFLQIIFQTKENDLDRKIKDIVSKNSKIFLPFWSLVFLCFVFILATIFSLDPKFSFWGSPYRGGGSLTFLMLATFGAFLFFILRERDWQKIWALTFIVGSLVSLAAIFQKFGILSKQLIPYTYRPISTMGGSMFLALYLVLLSFIALSFVLVYRNFKRYFYLFFFFLFLFVIFLTATRSAFLGIGTGLLFFCFAFPNYQKSKRIRWLKISFFLFLLIIFFSVLLLKNYPALTQKFSENKVFGVAFSRSWSLIEGFSVEEIARSRGSGWFIAFNGLKERPILGYGPENFSIAFDRHYNPNLPGVTKLPGGGGSSGWWDRGHNLIFDISISAGLLGLFSYLFLLAILFWRLQKIKYPKSFQNNSFNENNGQEDKRKKIIVSHGIQTALIAYFTTVFFNFDVFSSYLILFLIIGYTFYLIFSDSKSKEEAKSNQTSQSRHFYKEKKPGKYIFAFFLFSFLVLFISKYNLKPLYINAEINKAMLLERNSCQKAFLKMEKTIKERSYIDNYLRLQYIDILSNCMKKHPKDMGKIAKRGLQILEQATKLRPTYTRSWMYYGVYADKLIEAYPDISPEKRNEITKQAYPFFEKALEMSPNRPEILIAWGKLDLSNRDYQSAEKRANRCLELAPQEGRCYWLKALVYLYKEEPKKAADYMEIASEVYGFKEQSVSAISELIKVYAFLAKETQKKEYYQMLAHLYNKLLKIEPEKFQFRNFQTHASLAYVYKILGDYQKAREQALEVLKFSPQSKANVEAFLKTLPFPYNQMPGEE